MMKPQVAVCFIFFLSASVSGFSIFGSSKTKVDDFAVDDDTAEVVSSIIPFSQIPPTSFVKATLVSETSRPKEVVIEVQSKFNKPSKCETIEFLNMPKSLNTMSTNIFKQVDKKYNHHVAYTNGKEFLSYVDEGDHGTWILGMNPGVDSGYVYIRPKHDSLVPVGLESGSKWKWSVEKEWITYDDIKVVCNDYVDDDLPSSNFFFQVGMYNGNSDEMTKLIMTASPSSSSEAILFSLSSDDETIYLRDFKVVCSMGKTVRIHDTKNGRSTLARMVNHELGADQSWRITFRRANSHLHFSNSNPLPKLASAIKTTENDDQVWDNKSEVRLRLKSDGSIIENFTLNPLRVNEYLRNYRRQVSDIQSTQVGDYLWTWMRHSYSTNISTQFLGSVVGDEEGALLAPPTDSIEEVFLMCVGKSDTHWLFRHYPFNRRDQMQQSILSRDTELVQIAISPSGTSTTASQTCSSGTRSNALITAFEGLHDHNVSSLDQLSIHVEDGANMITKHYHLLDVMFVGRNPMTLIKNYIYDVEGVLAEDVSSCYMYHAGVSIPASLIYATEVMCVLIGAKPVNLIQYTSDTDASWKFPVMTELVQAVMSARYLHNGTLGKTHPDVPFDIAYRIQKYKKYDTLVLYRTETAYIADNILPRGTAQALHPMPFPDTSRLVQDHRLQIYNAAWNGLILGYPSRFVLSYCKDFHNDLPGAEKEQIYQTAKRELETLLRDKYGMSSIPTIKVGMVPPVHNLIWDSIEKLLLSQPQRLQVKFESK